MKKLITLFVALFAAAQCFAQNDKPVFYMVSFPNAAHHEAEIEMTIPQAPSSGFKIRMSRSSAGRYATHEFGKNIYNLKATDVDGKEIPLTQIEGDVWEVADNHPAVIKVSYTLFANWTDGTYAAIDLSHAHLNMPAVFMWSPNLQDRRIKIEFNDIDKYNWKVATQLKNEGGNVYSAPTLQYLMDSPTELSNFKESSWTVTNTDGKKETINLVEHSDDDQAVVDNYAKMVQKVVLEEKAIYGELPTYDFGEYTFISDVYPTNSPDGMEHRNSTCIVSRDAKIEGNENRELGTFAHEYFHSWNVKRIRPKSLEPFNFEHADMTSELWFAEGFTQYYGELALVRAGFRDVDQYSNTLAGLVNQILNTPGATKYSETQMSRYAVFADAGVSIDPTNMENMFTSYYTYGGATALALDLRLRSEFNITLDDYMRAVWLALGKVQHPYVIADLQKVLTKLTNPKFADDFFKKYIYGTDKNDYAALLAKAGLVLQKAAPGKVWAGDLNSGYRRGRSGMVTGNAATGWLLQNNTIIGSPVYKAGLDAGDMVSKADGKDIHSAQDFLAVVNAKNAGDKITVDYTDRTGAHQTTVILEESPELQVITFEKAGKQPTAEQLDFRNKWLSSKVK